MSVRPWGRMVGVRPSKQLHLLLDENLSYGDAWARMQEHHGISKEKFDLLWQVAAVERPFLSESSHPDLFSVYIGIPFCPTRCLYCSFPSHSLQELGKLRSRFVDTLLYEIEIMGRQMKSFGMRPYCFYVGGGTPTSLSPSDLSRVLTALQEAFPGPLREFTVEAGRPDTISSEHLAVLQKHGVNRISINPQTMHRQTLENIGRCHTPEDVYRAVTEVRDAKIPVLNMDLILGLPGETVDMVRKSVQGVLALAPENVTLHMFSRKRASRFTEETGRYPLPGNDLATAMYRTATSFLSIKYLPYYTYRQREILGGQDNIGYSLPGTECVYNISMIEERHHILGLGGGATTKIIGHGHTLTNIATPKDVRMYMERVRELCQRRQAAFYTHKNGKTE